MKYPSRGHNFWFFDAVMVALVRGLNRSAIKRLSSRLKQQIGAKMAHQTLQFMIARRIEPLGIGEMTRGAACFL